MNARAKVAPAQPIVRSAEAIFGYRQRLLGIVSKDKRRDAWA